MRAGHLRKQAPAMIDWLGVDVTEPIAPDEEWRPVEGFPKYEVSNYGRVRSVWRASGPQLMKPSPHKGGYFWMAFGKHNEAVHHLVLKAFVGPKPQADTECRHLDGNPANNKLDNLVWGTRRENYEDKIRHGTETKSETIWTVKLTPNQVQEIRVATESAQNLAEKYGVTKSAIWGIRSGKNWRKLEGAPEIVPGHRRGSGSGKAKLTEEQVLAMRASLKLPRELAEQYGVGITTVYMILKRRTWTHI